MYKLKFFSNYSDSKIDQNLYEQRLLKLLDKLIEAKTMADKNNKLVLLVLGEAHRSKHGLNVILDIMRLCRSEFQTRDVAIEYDNLQSFLRVAKEQEEHNANAYLDFFTQENWSLIPVDKYHSLVTSYNNGMVRKRNEGTIEELLSEKVTNDVVCIIGANHLADLRSERNQTLLNQKYQSIFVNTCDYPSCCVHPSSIEYQFTLKEENTFQLTQKSLMKKG